MLSQVANPFYQFAKGFDKIGYAAATVNKNTRVVAEKEPLKKSKQIVACFLAL